jgi:quercetin dioxygenase-like cupin family protein
MNLQVVQTDKLAAPLEAASATPTPLIRAQGVQTLLLDLGSGQSVGPCEMRNTVLYYVIRGRGRLEVGDEASDLREGTLAVVAAGSVRRVSAIEPMRLLLVQIP